MRVILGMICLMAFSVNAQEYPAKPIRILVTIPPGGAPDLGDNFAVLNAPVGDSSFTGALPGNSTAYTLHLSVQSPAGQTVPEPLTLILFGAGMTAAAFRLRRH